MYRVLVVLLMPFALLPGLLLLDLGLNGRIAAAIAPGAFPGAGGAVDGWDVIPAVCGVALLVLAAWKSVVCWRLNLPKALLTGTIAQLSCLAGIAVGAAGLHLLPASAQSIDGPVLVGLAGVTVLIALGGLILGWRLADRADRMMTAGMQPNPDDLLVDTPTPARLARPIAPEIPDGR